MVTVGCPKNVADSDRLTSRLTAEGFELVDEAEAADAIIVNTCGFIAPACEESLDTILELAELKSDGDCRCLVAAGCMVERYGDELRAELPEVDEFFGLAEENADAIAEYLAGRLSERRAAPGGVTSTDSPAQRPTTRPATPYAYVKISDGCDRTCSFCTIPSIRGRYRSRPAEQIAAEVSGLINRGIMEIVLVGQDTTAWGRDLRARGPEPGEAALADVEADSHASLATLLDDLATTHSDTWFRVMYLQPDSVTDELIDTIAAHANVCDYFDIPFQHASSRVLRSMCRAGDASSFLALVDKIRARIPDAALRTSLITGFPGETDADFDQLAAFIRDGKFDFAGTFAFSPEEGTEAAALPNQIDLETVTERQQMLVDLAEEVGAARAASRIGATLDVLIEDCPSEQDILSEGRSQFQAPEVDGVCLLAQRAAEGGRVRARVTDTEGYDMLCEPQ